MPQNSQNGQEIVANGTTSQERQFLYESESRSGIGRPAPMIYTIWANRKAARRKVSTFTVMIILFFTAITITLYVGNIISVNRLALEVNTLQRNYEKIVNANEILRAEVNRKSSLERISSKAVVLGLRFPKEQPLWLEVDEGKVKEMERK